MLLLLNGLTVTADGCTKSVGSKIVSVSIIAILMATGQFVAQEDGSLKKSAADSMMRRFSKGNCSA